MLPRRPGPSSTVSGRPVSTTGSPGLTPDVSSYTWIVVFSLRIRMTSPMSCSLPTNITSYIRGRSPVAVITGPATRRISPMPLAFTSVFAPNATLPTSFEQIDTDGPPDLRPEVLGFRGADRDDHGPWDGLQPSPHRVAQPLVVAGVQHQDPDVGIVEHLGDLGFEVLLRRGRGLAHSDELEPLHEVVSTHRSELHLTPPAGSG